MTAGPDLAALVARSRRLGADPDLVVHGGGNTSAKVRETDHLGRERLVLRIKGSGTDLRTAGEDAFPGVYLDEVAGLRERDAMTDEEMVAHLDRCLVEPRGRRPSIETLLHAFLPAAHVDHVHADAIVTLTNVAGAERIVAQALGDAVAFVPYVRPGFSLSRTVADLAGAEAVVLAHHGLVTWGDTSQESLDLTLDLVARAERYLAGRVGSRATGGTRRPDLGGDARRELLLRLRGRLSAGARRVLHVDAGQRDLADRDDVEAVAAAGAATADHILRVRRESVVVRSADDADPVIDAYERRERAYLDRHRGGLPAGLEPHEPLPRVALVPGLGAVTAGQDARAARTVAEVAVHTHRVAARVRDAFGEGRRLDEADEFAIDYWPLELAKLQGLPEPPELAGRIYVVTGAASGIGRTVARHLAHHGAALALGDLDGDGLERLAAELGAGTSVIVAGDLTEEARAAALVDAAVDRFGGLDGIVASAGIAVTGRLAELSLADWDRALAVNTTSHFLVARRALAVLERQGLGGSLVFISSKNAFGPGAGFGAYSASKAAVVQLARVAALEGGAIGVRANVVNPDAVFDGSRLWSDEVQRERAQAHGVEVSQLEDFYAQRNLLRARVTTVDVAESVRFLLSDRSARTTGCVLTVDGGVAAAFPR